MAAARPAGQLSGVVIPPMEPMPMPAWLKIRFSDEAQPTDWYGSRGFYYEFADGSNIGLKPTIAWCNGCNSFVDAEWIPSLAEIENELAELNDPTSFRASVFTSTEPPFDKSPYRERSARLYAEAKDEARKRIDWRRQRQASAKCLYCGSVDIVLPDDHGRVDIPNRGFAVVEFCGMCSTEFCNWYYTPEGDRIPRETRPTYWHLPEEEG
jgi:hypothetical protein